MTCRIF